MEKQKKNDQESQVLSRVLDTRFKLLSAERANVQRIGRSERAAAANEPEIGVVGV